MRVIHVCPFMGEQLGGSERYVFNLSKVQSKSYDVHILTSTRYPSRVGVSKENGVTIHRLYSPVTIWNIDPVTLAIRKLSSIRYDLLHIHSYLYTLSAQAAISNYLQRRRSILHIHGGLGPPPYKTSLPRRVIKAFYDKSVGKFVIETSDIVASVSHRDLGYLESVYGISPHRLRHIPNVVDTEKFSPAQKSRETDGRTLIYVGDLERWKGLDLIMRWAIQTENGSDYPINIQFVGQGSYYEKLVKLQRHLSTNGNGISIEVLGQRPHHEIPELVCNADVLILPSFWEGMPTVVLEAMSCGTPVIATPVGDIPNMISNGVDGFIIDNNIESLDWVIEKIVKTPQLVDSMGKKARMRVRNEFSLRAVSNKLKEVYESLRPS